MNRRDLIKSMAFISSHALFPTVLSSFLAGCSSGDADDHVPVFFDKAEYKAIREIIDIIIPRTETPAASEVKTEVFLDEVFSKCLGEEQQALIHGGLRKTIPLPGPAEDKIRLFEDIDKKAFSGDEDFAWFKTIKKFTLVGFFTSREGTTRASNYVPVPDAYKGEITADASTLNYGKTNLHY